MVFIFLADGRKTLPNTPNPFVMFGLSEPGWGKIKKKTLMYILIYLGLFLFFQMLYTKLKRP